MKCGATSDRAHLVHKKIGDSIGDVSPELRKLLVKKFNLQQRMRRNPDDVNASKEYAATLKEISECKDSKSGDPLTEKGQEIMAAMKKQYGEKCGEEIFYASRNKGTIKGVDPES